MKRRLAVAMLLALMAGMLSGCGAIVVEDAGSVQIGAAG